MTPEEQIDLIAAITRVERAVIALPFSGGVVRSGVRNDSLIERLSVVEQNVQAIHDQYDSFNGLRRRTEADAESWRQSVTLARKILAAASEPG